MIDRQRFETLLTLIVIAVFLLGVAVAWFALPWLSGAKFVIAITVAILALVVVGFVLSLFFQAYVFEVRRLTEELEVIMQANPGHRVTVDGSADMQRLADTINTFSGRFQHVLDNQAAQIEQARANLEKEKNTLAALMSELTEGVLVCNVEGQILLYNSRAKQLLSQPPGHQPGGSVGGLVGLGRSVFGLLDRNAITHTLEELAYRGENQNGNPTSSFVTTATNGQLIRARMAPVMSQQQEVNGFVITLEDITRISRRSSRRDALLQSLTEGIRAALANIRTAIETIEDYPQMDAAKLGQLHKVISEESLTLSARLNQVTTDHAADMKADWQLEEVLGSDLLWAIQRRFEDKLKVSTTLEIEEENLWLKVDNYLIVRAVTYIMRRLQTDYDINQATLRLKKTGQLAALDLLWNNAIIDADILWSWQNQALTTDKEGLLTLKEVAERHGGEVWSQTDAGSNTAYFRLLLPTVRPKMARALPVALADSRPEYYDFDLFQQPDRKPELEERLLTDLTYSVFDTETTGLDPSGGDEIISIGAVRIVNGRLLRQEIFDQLIDPRRPVTTASVEVHGISAEMLAGQPTIEQVLPAFSRFAEGTVLVGHNAAFDMRLLQMKEAKTGIKFTNPVLDTLLLSAALHPNQERHSLEAIAERLGINIIGRHTALGDAILTGNIFLKLIPLLAERDILTLAAARRAAQQTYYARLKY